MIVACGQLPQLPAIAFPASVLAAGGAIAIATPIAEALGNFFQVRSRCHDRTALAGGNVVGRVKATSGQVPPIPHVLAAQACAQSIAAILDQPHPVLLAQITDSLTIKG